MKKKNYKKIAHDVINLEIKALQKLKKSINSSFDQAVEGLSLNASLKLFYVELVKVG